MSKLLRWNCLNFLCIQRNKSLLDFSEVLESFGIGICTEKATGFFISSEYIQHLMFISSQISLITKSFLSQVGKSVDVNPPLKYIY
jgi:hypothetical protein